MDKPRPRLREIKNENTRGIRALCLDPLDLALAKYAASREKALAFNHEMAEHGFVQRERLETLVEEMSVDADRCELIRARIRRDFAKA